MGVLMKETHYNQKYIILYSATRANRKVPRGQTYHCKHLVFIQTERWKDLFIFYFSLYLVVLCVR